MCDLNSHGHLNNLCLIYELPSHQPYSPLNKNYLSVASLELERITLLLKHRKASETMEMNKFSTTWEGAVRDQTTVSTCFS